MKVVKRDLMPNGTKIQIEDWNKEYSFKNKNSTIGAYPISKHSLEGQFSPKRNRSFRFTMELENEKETQNIFNKLIAGEIGLLDCSKHHSGDKKELKCI